MNKKIKSMIFFIVGYLLLNITKFKLPNVQLRSMRQTDRERDRETGKERETERGQREELGE